MPEGNRITIRYAGIDGWNRAVFVTIEGRHFYKSVELMSHPDFQNLPPEDKDILLRTLHSTDEFEGEPGWPVPREHFELVE